MEERAKTETGRRTRARESTRLLRLLCVLPVALVALVQYPVLWGSFYVDDYLNLYDAIHNGPLEFILRIHGGHSLIVRNALFYLTHQLFGLDPLPYLLTALAIHLANVALLQRVLRHFTASPLLAALGATLWGVSPVAFGVIGWYSAACHAMLTTLLLWVLGDLARASYEESEIGRGTAIRWCLLLLAGASTFGIGIGAAMVFPLVVFLLLPAGSSRRRTTLVVGSLAAVVPVLYLAQEHAMEVVVGAPNDPVLRLGFSMALSQSFRVLRSLVDFSSYGLASLLLGPWVTTTETGVVVGGPFGVHSATWVMELAHGLFVVFGVALAGFVWKGPKQQRRPIAAVVLLCVVSYGCIVVGRLFLYQASPAFGMQPRYHYLGPLLLGILVSFLVGWLGRSLGLPSRARIAAAMAFLVVWAAVSCRSVHDISAVLYVQGIHEFAQANSYLKRSIERAPPGSAVFINNRQPFSHGAFKVLWQRDPARFPGLAAVFVILYPDDVVAGRKVYFVEKDPERLEAMRRRPHSRISRLVVSPREARLLR
jgi:hypothetical protein